MRSISYSMGCIGSYNMGCITFRLVFSGRNFLLHTAQIGVQFFTWSVYVMIELRKQQ